jgi:hypothetical protein
LGDLVLILVLTHVRTRHENSNLVFKVWEGKWLVGIRFKVRSCRVYGAPPPGETMNGKGYKI